MMRKVFLAVVPMLLASSSASAQSWGWGGWGDTGPSYREPRARSYYYDDRDRYYYAPPPRYRDYPPPGNWRPYRPGASSFLDPDEEPRRRPGGADRAMPSLTDGGPRPDIAPVRPQRIGFRTHQPVGTIIIDTAGRQLLLVQPNDTALRYPISVGRDGFAWTGEEKISRIAEWPDWHPPAEMRERDPRLPEKMTGGLRNPLGAKALYLGSTLYRIHGTNDANSIGRASSSGCFRMLNGHVIDLASRVGVGTKVVVTQSLRTAEAR